MVLRTMRTGHLLAVVILAVFFIFMSLLSCQYLGKYYYLQQRQALIESKQMIERIYKGNPKSVSAALKGLESQNRLYISLFSPDNEIKYDSSEGAPLVLSILPYLSLTKGDFIIDVSLNPRLKSEFLTLISRLNNGDLLILNSPLSMIDESIAIADGFFLFSGFTTVVLGGVAIFRSVQAKK